MRVVVVHNRYRSAQPSGENAIVDHEIEVLGAAGHEVFPYLRDSDEIADFGLREKARLAVRPVHSREDTRRFAVLLDESRGEIVHVHNVFPLISPSVVRVASSRGIPVVQSVYNYRHGCVAGTYYRDGHICEDCLDRRVPWPAVAHGCYRGSRAQTLPMATAQLVHRMTWRAVDRFLPVTGFLAGKLQDIGIPADRIVVRPNAVPDPGAPRPPGTGFLFAGRFAPEKGVLLLLDAWRRSGLGTRDRLVLAGDGPLREEVVRAAAGLSGVTLAGGLPREEVGRLMSEAATVVVPSLWYEGFPQVIVEAFARGRPVVVTAVGALTHVVDDEVGWVVTPDPAALAAAMVEIADLGLRGRDRAARARYLDRFTPEVVLAQLLDVYESVRR